MEIEAENLAQEPLSSTGKDVDTAYGYATSTAWRGRWRWSRGQHGDVHGVSTLSPAMEIKGGSFRSYQRWW
jgi:hypothetical protein